MVGRTVGHDQPDVVVDLPREAIAVGVELEALPLQVADDVHVHVVVVGVVRVEEDRVVLEARVAVVDLDVEVDDPVVLIVAGLLHLGERVVARGPVGPDAVLGVLLAAVARVVDLLVVVGGLLPLVARQLGVGLVVLVGAGVDGVEAIVAAGEGEGDRQDGDQARVEGRHGASWVVDRSPGRGRTESPLWTAYG